MIEEIGFNKVHMRVLSDATAAAIAMAKRRGPGRVRHLEIKQLWIQEVVGAGLVTLRHLPSAENPADLLTKPMSGDRHLKLRRKL